MSLGALLLYPLKAREPPTAANARTAEREAVVARPFPGSFRVGAFGMDAASQSHGHLNRIRSGSLQILNICVRYLKSVGKLCDSRDWRRMLSAETPGRDIEA